jgi:fatty acid desaturase
MKHTLTQEDAQEIAYVRQEIRAASSQLRSRYPILKHKDLLGGGALLLATAVVFLVGYLYASDLIPWYVAVPLAGLAVSIFHEIEHDLIHLLYFKDSRLMYHLALGLTWLMRPSSINPWSRRRMHMHHHKLSGTLSDIEEVGITNGARWGVKRLFMLLDGLLGVLLQPVTMKKAVAEYIQAQPNTVRDRKKILAEQAMTYVPLSLIYYCLWYLWVISHAILWLQTSQGLVFPYALTISRYIELLDLLAVAYLVPNFLASFSLNFISSNMHYYSEGRPLGLIKQTQVLNSWWMLPFKLFCFNFGATHPIHHFVVGDPFYMRELTAKTAHAAMRKVGVRFNDFGTFGRANRWS